VLYYIVYNIIISVFKIICIIHSFFIQINLKKKNHSVEISNLSLTIYPG